METLKRQACAVDWVARLRHSWLLTGKATRISYERNSTGTIQMLKVEVKKQKQTKQKTKQTTTKKHTHTKKKKTRGHQTLLIFLSLLTSCGPFFVR